MTRAYLRLDPDFSQRKAAYPDGPYRALIDAFCAAESEPKRGYFRSLPVLKAILGRSARHLPYLFEHGDLRSLPDGRIYVVGWDEWQEGDWQVAERMRRVRARREGVGEAAVTPGAVTPVTPPTVTRPSSGGGGGKPLAVGGGGDVPPSPEAPDTGNGFDVATWTKVQLLAEELTGVSHALPNPYGGLGAQALGQATSPDVPWSKFESAYRQVAKVYGRPTARQLVFDAENLLRPTGLVGSTPPREQREAQERLERRRALGLEGAG